MNIEKLKDEILEMKTIKKSPCDIFDGNIEDKVSELLARGKEVPDNLMECYKESKKFKESKMDAII